jgi:hypothetical protein
MWTCSVDFAFNPSHQLQQPLGIARENLLLILRREAEVIDHLQPLALDASERRRVVKVWKTIKPRKPKPSGPVEKAIALLLGVLAWRLVLNGRGPPTTRPPLDRNSD